MMSNFRALLAKIENFKISFYKFNFYKGLLISITSILILLFFFIFLNYLFYFSIGVKKFLFYFFILLSILIFFEFSILPILRLFKILPQLTFLDFVNLITNKHGIDDDKLINVYELSLINSPIAKASIEQKSKLLIQNYDYENLYSAKLLIRFIKYPIILIIAFLLMFFFNSSMVSTGFKKFIDYKNYYYPHDYVEFILLNDSLNYPVGSDVEIKLKLKTKVKPQHVYLVLNSGLTLQMIDYDSIFSCTIKSVNQPFSFTFSTGKYSSKTYRVNLYTLPILSNVRFLIEPPKYTNVKPFQIINSTSFKIPQYSNIRITANVYNTDSIFIFFNDSLKLKSNINFNKFSFTIFSNTTLSFLLKNSFASIKLLTSNIEIIPDNYPKIFVNQVQDSIKKHIYYVRGKISDDYGFSKLLFKYTFDDTNFYTIPIEILRGLNEQEFFYIIDLSVFEKFDYLKYFFEVYDNDAYRFKKVQSEYFILSKLNKSQKDSLIDVYQSSSFDIFNNMSLRINELSNDFDEIMLNQYNKNYLDLKLQLNELIDNSMKLQKDVETLLKNNVRLKNIDNFDDKLKNQFYDSITNFLKSILENDLKKLLDSLQKIYSDKNLSKLQNNRLMTIQEMYKNINSELLRIKDLYKRFFIQNKVSEISEKLEDLAEKIKKIDEKNFLDSISSLKTEYNNFFHEYQNILEENKNLIKPMDLKDFMLENIQIQNTFNQLNKNSNLKNKLSNEIKNLSEKMKNQIDEQSKKENTEDYDAVLSLFYSLISLTEVQKNLLTEFKSLNTSSPNILNSFALKQIKIKNSYKSLYDSLRMIASRNFLISKTLTDKLNEAQDYINKAIDAIKTNKKNDVIIYQNIVLKNFNDISLLLSESLNNISNMGNSQMGKNTKKRKNQFSLPQLSDLQKSLQEQLQNMINLKNYSINNLAEQLMKREQLENMLKSIIQQLDPTSDVYKILNEVLNINKSIIQDIVNNNISINTLKKDSQINVKLLEAQNAELEQKNSNKREANVGKNFFRSVDSINVYTNNTLFIYKSTIFKNKIILIQNLNLMYYEYFSKITRTAE